MSANDHSEPLSLAGLLFTGAEADCGSLEDRITQYFFVWREALCRYLYVILRDQGEAEDLTQESFLRLYQELRQKRQINETKGWLFRTGHNLAVDHHRRRDTHSQATSLALPVSIIGTFAVMYLLGYSLNNLTMLRSPSPPSSSRCCSSMGSSAACFKSSRSPLSSPSSFRLRLRHAHAHAVGALSPLWPRRSPWPLLPIHRTRLHRYAERL